MKKSLLSHLIAAIVGGLAATVWFDHSADHASTQSNGQLLLGAETGRFDTKVSTNGEPRPTKSLLSQAQKTNIAAEKSARINLELEEGISEAQLQRWLESKEGNSESIAEANAIVGLLTDNPDLIRKGISMDPKNPYLLYLGANVSEFSSDERLTLSERFYSLDPKNSLAGFLYAARLLDSGKSDAAIEILREAQDRESFDDYSIQTILSMQDAFIGAEVSPVAAKIMSANRVAMPYIFDVSSMVDSLNAIGAALPAEGAADLRQLTTAMAMRITGEPSARTIVSQLSSLALEEKILEGLQENAMSPYEGLTVAEAKAEIASEREQIEGTMRQVFDLNWESGIISDDQLFQSRYIDRFMLLGELEAQRWAIRNLQGKNN